MSPRIASLLPSATELVVALGLGEHLVGVTHECDEPAWVRDLPSLTASAFDPHAMSQGEIDARVQASLRDDLSLYPLRASAFAAAAPTHVITQALCAVCAIDASTVEASCAGLVEDARLPGAPEVLSLTPTDLAGLFGGFADAARFLGVPERGEVLVTELRARLDEVRAAVAGRPRPRVVFLEWMDPPFPGGHWVPELLAIAGAEDALWAPGMHSARLSWDEVRAVEPDLWIAAPCGFDLDRAVADVRSLDLPGRVLAVDGNATFSRPGPRVVEGAAAVAEALHGADLGASDLWRWV